MLAVVSWHCDCGVSVKAMYETDGDTRLRCPNAFCENIHTVAGEITEVWIKNSDAGWQPHDIVSLVVN